MVRTQVTTRVGTGRSLDDDSRAASVAAAGEACRPLDGPADVCLVFATACHDQRAILDGVARVAGSARIVGCSGEGVISRSHSDECEHAVVVMAIRSGTLSFEPMLTTRYAADPAGAGTELAERVGRDLDGITGMFVFPDGLSGNCTSFLAGLKTGLEGGCPIIVGGTSGDAMTFDRTYQYLDGEVHTGAASALLVRGGSLRVAVSHGCTPIGLERRVTKVDAEWVIEIDDEPAWAVFKEYLDGDPADLNAEGMAHLCVGLPLAESLRASSYGTHVIRTPLKLDQASGALHFPGGGIQQDQTIRITRRDRERITESAKACVRQIWDVESDRAPVAVFQFDCAGRGRILFGSSASDHIVRPLQNTAGRDVPWIGFHTYGEIAPIGSRPYYHNYTVVLCALYDEVRA